MNSASRQCFFRHCEEILVLTSSPKGILFASPASSRFSKEAGYEVRPIDLYKRGKYEAAEIRHRILKGEDWSDLVPPDVHRIVLEIDGENRIRDLAKSDSVNYEDDNHGISYDR